MECTVEALYVVLVLTNKIEMSDDEIINKKINQIKEEHFTNEEIKELKKLNNTYSVASYLELHKMQDIKGYLNGYQEYCEEKVKEYEEFLNRQQNA